jgi:hypothetical protein
MSSSEEPSFTVELHGSDFILHTGVPSHRLSEEIVKKITKCKGEYDPSDKGFVVPHGELCNLLDECFDYFTEESLLSIASLVDGSTADQNTKDRVREKSVSKSRASKKKKEESKLDVISEEKPKGKTRESEEEKPKGKTRESEEEKPKGKTRESEEEKPRSKTRDLEEKLVALEKQREDEKRREIERRLLREEERRRVEKEEERRLVREEERRREIERRLLREEQGRFKASPVRFRAPEPLFPSSGSSNSRVKKSVNFESGNEELRREVIGMMSSLRTSVSDIKVNMARLEQLIARNF